MIITKKKIRDAALFSNFSMNDPSTAIKTAHLYWAIAPYGIEKDKSIKDIFILDQPIVIKLHQSVKTTGKEKVLIAFNKIVNELYKDWKKGKIERDVLDSFSYIKRTLTPTSKTIFITDIPDGFQDMIIPYKDYV